jgi:hypothetical protein
MKCPKCHARVAPEDVNVQALIAKCGRCGEVFRIDEELGRNGSVTPPELRRPKPDRLKVEDDGVNRRICYRWFRPAFLFLVVFCVFWDGFLFVWYSIAFTDANAPLMMKVFPILHVLVGVFLTYYVLCTLVNRTVIEVGEDAVSVRHGPLPAGSSQRVDTAEIVQIYCEEGVVQGRNGASFYYNVHALLKEDRSIKLLRNLQDKDLALFIEQQLEEWLKITPRHVKGAIN